MTWARVAAVPERMTITPGASLRPFGCDGPGISYQRASATHQAGACTYLYQESSLYQAGHAYAVTVTVIWDGTWLGSGNGGGALPPVVRTTTFSLPVAEGQALVTKG